MANSYIKGCKTLWSS